QYKEIREGSEGLIPVREAASWGFLDRQGHLIIKPEFSTVDRFRDGWAKVTCLSGREGFVNRDGHFSKTKPEPEGVMAVTTVTGEP
ncbi:MAG: WG repeat-containing protein, partial [Verrucomicrobia bacterium]|nr:WG repeat-containing protein [Verrucomicrobiota bacterium]